MPYSDQCNTRTVSYDLIQLSYIFQKCQYKRLENKLKRLYKNKQGNMFNSMRTSNPQRFYGKFRKRKKNVKNLNEYFTLFCKPCFFSRLTLAWMPFFKQCNTRTVSYDLIQLSYIFKKCQLTVHSFYPHFHQ
jgi:hypothetical protein